MMRFLAGCGIGLFAGYLLGIQVFLIACLALLALVILLFFLFHLGVRDFQE
jgi:hypothetical protein